MEGRARTAAVAGVVLAGIGIALWLMARDPAEREIRRRLDAFAAEFNASTTDGLGTVARAARLGSFFTPDVAVELGQGAGPIRGRETLIGMAARLQPRTAAFSLELNDVTVEVAGEDRADVTLTAVFRRRAFVSGEESLDAREFALEMRYDDGDWRVGRLVAVDTFR